VSQHNNTKPAGPDNSYFQPYYVKMEKIARLVRQVSWDIANADSRPKPPPSRTVAR
jgi:hypothetical protein